MQKQRCAKCGQEWWDAHACPMQLTAAQAPMPGMLVNFQTPDARAEWLAKHMPTPFDACACIGPQNGQPLCPCAMRGVVVKNGRYVRPEQDLGPAAPTTGE
jgi:hypothetical protein